MAEEFPQVVVVGSCMMDLVSYVPRLPKVGETIHGKSFTKGFGGKGANQCVMAAKLGARTAMVAKVGDDAFGKDTLDNFKANGINDYESINMKQVKRNQDDWIIIPNFMADELCDCVSLDPNLRKSTTLHNTLFTRYKPKALIRSRSKHFAISMPRCIISMLICEKDKFIDVVHAVASGVAFITVDDEGENSIVIVSGANGLLTIADVHKAETLMKHAAVVVCQLEIAAEASLAAMKLGKECGATTILNAAPASQMDCHQFFKYIDILCINESEAEVLCGIKVLDLESGHKAVTLLKTHGPVCVVLTMGAQGVIFTDYPATQSCVVQHKSAEKVEVIDTTGAGDAFVGALAYHLATHPELTFEKVIELSVRIASHSVTSRGTQSSYNVEHF